MPPPDLKKAALAGLSACLIVLAPCALAQPGGTPGQESRPEASPSAKVDVRPDVSDAEIARRLQDILNATNWFPTSQVTVKDGVVFLTGQALTEESRRWAGDLARNTEGVVAVANSMTAQQDVWDFQSARAGIVELREDAIRALPFLVLALVVLALSFGVSLLARRAVRSLLRDRISSRLIRGTIAWSVGVFVLFVGLYVVLRVSGLTQLALTVMGGTGLIGLVLGIAFRGITENFLASLFLSMQKPFETGDLIAVAGEIGYVQQLNVRSTVLLTENGNIVQVPNATMYQEVLRNFTASPNRRESFVVGIGYDDAIDRAQHVALAVLADHPAVLAEPEPMVLADNLGKATVDLKIYFWLNGREHSPIKVRSSVIRLVKRAFQQNGITMPDEAREVVFPQSVPVVLLHDDAATTDTVPASKAAADPDGSVSTQAEAGLASDASMLKEQARRADPSGQGENLLAPTRAA